MIIGHYSEEELISLGFMHVGKNVKISKTVQLHNINKISIGNNVRIDNFCTLAPSGNSVLYIGNFVQICAYCFFNGLEDIVINDFCVLANFTQVFSTMDDYSGNHLAGAVVPRHLIGSISKKVEFGKHTLIAPSCVILPGVETGIGTAIGSHSLVKESTKEFSIYAGIPAKFIKNRSSKIIQMESLVDH